MSRRECTRKTFSLQLLESSWYSRTCQLWYTSGSFQKNSSLNRRWRIERWKSRSNKTYIIPYNISFGLEFISMSLKDFTIFPPHPKKKKKKKKKKMAPLLTNLYDFLEVPTFKGHVSKFHVNLPLSLQVTVVLVTLLL